MRRWVLLGFGILLVPVALFGCGGAAAPPDGDGDDGDGGGLPQDELAATVAHADDASDQFDALCADRGWPTASAAFVEWARGQDYVTEANEDSATHEVTLVYDTGVFHVFHPDDQHDAAAVPAAQAQSDVGPGARFIPSTPHATAATSHPADVDDIAAVEAAVQTFLDAAEGAGYTVPSAAPAATIDWFRSWPENGIIFLQGHGGYANFTRTFGVARLYCLQTSERFSAAEGAGFGHGGDLASGRMGFWTVEGHPDERALTVSTRFFEHYCDPMATGAVVYLNCCHSLEHDPELADVLCGQNAELVVGWDGLCPRPEGAALARYLADRLLALNDVEPQTPRQRPFTFDQVFAHMAATRTISFTLTDGPGRLTWSRGTAGETTTSGVPVVSGGYYIPPSSVYPHPFVNLQGYFTRPQGHVYLGDTECTVSAWSETAITATVPETGPDSAGDLVVRVLGLDSNPLRMTRFDGTIDVAVNEPGRYSGTVNVDFGARGLTQLIRSEVDGTPATMTGPFEACHVYADTGTITWDITGEWTDDDGDLHEVEASGSAPVLNTTVGGQVGMALILVLDLVANQWQLDIAIVVDGTETITTPEGAATTQPWVRGFASPGYTDPVALAADWRVPAGTVNGDNSVISWGELLPDPDPPGPAVHPASLPPLR